jgi:cyanamide hydratase
MSVDPNISFYGFTPVPRDPDVLFADHPTGGGDHPKQDPFTVDDFPLPDSPLVGDVKAFVKVSIHTACRPQISRLTPTTDQKELDEQTFNHSNRVYIYGMLN